MFVFLPLFSSFCPLYLTHLIIIFYPISFFYIHPSPMAIFFFFCCFLASFDFWLLSFLSVAVLTCLHLPLFTPFRGTGMDGPAKVCQN